jgi:hypothetical protein
MTKSCLQDAILKKTITSILKFSLACRRIRILLKAKRVRTLVEFELLVAEEQCAHCTAEASLPFCQQYFQAGMLA